MSWTLLELSDQTVDSEVENGDGTYTVGFSGTSQVQQLFAIKQGIKLISIECLGLFITNSTPAPDIMVPAIEYRLRLTFPILTNHYTNDSYNSDGNVSLQRGFRAMVDQPIQSMVVEIVSAFVRAPSLAVFTGNSYRLLLQLQFED